MPRDLPLFITFDTYNHNVMFENRKCYFLFQKNQSDSSKKLLILKLSESQALNLRPNRICFMGQTKSDWFSEIKFIFCDKFDHVVNFIYLFTLSFLQTSHS